MSEPILSYIFRSVHLDTRKSAHTHDSVYVIEFKLDASAAAALAQIRNKQYGSAFLEQGKAVIAVGINFSSEEKAVTEWQAIPYASLF